MARILDPPAVRAAWWAWRSALRTRRRLSAVGLDATAVPPPPRLRDAERRIVAGVLRRMGATCLVRSMVLQAWDSSHGRSRALVIGVVAPSKGFRAHAWLEGDPACRDEFTEFTRRSPCPADPPRSPAKCRLSTRHR